MRCSRCTSISIASSPPIFQATALPLLFLMEVITTIYVFFEFLIYLVAFVCFARINEAIMRWVFNVENSLGKRNGEKRLVVMNYDI